MVRSTIAPTAAAAFALANAQGPPPGVSGPSISKQCPFEDICYSLNLPTTTFTQGGGDLLFQISAPAKYSWVALGQGERMDGANIFVIYSNGNGNVTLSPRLGEGHEMPEYKDDAEVELLAGSGIMNGRMIANFKCSNCDSWDGGDLNLKSDIAMWIAAAKEGPPLDTEDVKAELEVHTINQAFLWSMIAARGGPDTNPFVAPAGRPMGGPLPGYWTRMGTVHGSLASLAFLFLFPVGAIFIRFAKFKGVVWVHAGIQLLAYACFIVSGGLGIYMITHYPQRYGRYDMYTDPHPKIGMALLVYLFLQACSGFVNHWLFGKKGKRLISHHIHVWGGRVAVLLGMINGGFGQKLGRVMSTGHRAAYGVVVTTMGILFLANIVWATAQMKRGQLNPSHYHRVGNVGEMEEGVSSDNQGHVRMESMEERERLHERQQNRLV